MSFQGLNTAYSGLRANQAGLDVTAHNIANAGTEGYTRQRAELRTRRPYQSSVGAMGAGVQVTEVSRRREALQDERVRAESEVSGRLAARSQVLGGVEGLYGELDQSLSGDLDAVFRAFDDLSLRPDDDSLRTLAISALDAFTTRVNGVSEGLSQVREDARGRLEATATDANQLAKDIASLNDAVRDAMGQGTAPNDLEDERDVLVDEFVRLTGATVDRNRDGSLRLSVDGYAIVDGSHTRELSVSHGPQTSQIEVAPWGDITAGGELAGFQSAMGTDLVGFEADLDAFVTELAAALNDANAAGFTAPGTPGGPLLDATGGAAGLTVVGTPADIAAASEDPPAPLDGRNAAAMAAMREATLPSGNTPISGLDAITTTVGRRVATVRTDAQRQDAILAGVESGRQSAHGVNLDEEMVALISHQRALEASSRVLSAVDQTLDILINRTGMVGR